MLVMLALGAGIGGIGEATKQASLDLYIISKSMKYSISQKEED